MIQRVNGSLAVSRALGDYDYKNSPNLPPTEQLVSAEPELDIIERSNDDEFLLVACDGVWDVMSNQEIVDYITSRLLVHSDLNIILEELLETCLGKGSRDNMSAILITFPNAPKVSEEAVEKEAALNASIREEIEKLVQEHGQDTRLNVVCDTLQNCNFPNLPPGGGIKSKLMLIEKTLDALVPERNEEQQSQAPGFNLPMPMRMFRQLAAQDRDLGFDDDEMEPGDDSGADTGVVEENGSTSVSE